MHEDDLPDACLFQLLALLRSQNELAFSTDLSQRAAFRDRACKVCD